MMMVFGFVPFLLLFAGLGIYRAFRPHAGDPAPHEEPPTGTRSRRLDSVVFGLAKRMGGRVTLSDVVIETGMGLAAAERYMDSLVDQAHVSIEVEEQGRLVYEFPELSAESGDSR